MKKIDFSLAHLPVTLMEPDGFSKETPTVFMYHGWTKDRHQMFPYAEKLVEEGVRVLLPDSFGHGERSNEAQVHDDALFFSTIYHNAVEFPQLLQDLKAQDLLTGELGVTGLSMGGITSSMLLAHYQEIDAGSIMMGTPELLQFINLLTLSASQKQEALPLFEEADRITDQLKPFDLSFHYDQIKDTPVLFWHGKIDTVVPSYLTRDFFSRNYTTKEHFLVIHPSAGHHVSEEEKLRSAVYLSQVLTGKSSKQAFDLAQKRVASAFPQTTEYLFS